MKAMFLSLSQLSPIFYPDILCSILDNIGKIKLQSADEEAEF